MDDAELEVAGGVFLSATYRLTGFTRTTISTLNLESGNDGDESAKCRYGFRRCIKSVVSVSVRILHLVVLVCLSQCTVSSIFATGHLC
ncbi:hypothetical protein PLICRDRAFT_620514 [Plicaturopsis crispa FD-325 SS-3]|nr:hypothetical protein PLICRDRAFT_620514 [Plicaturopsis crispa FD-325 SS-3]